MKRAAIVLLALLAVPATASAAIPTGNLVANPGFEEGPSAGPATAPPPAVPKWLTLEAPQRGRALRFQDGFYSATAATTAGAGCRGYVGPSAPADADEGPAGAAAYGIFQDVTMPVEAPGNATLTYSALLGRYGSAMTKTSDYGVLELRFLDGSKQTMSSVQINNYSTTSASTQELARKQATTAIPAGTAFLRIVASSVATFGLLGEHEGPANGLVDDVKVTFDTALPGDPPAGCQPAVPSTGDAGGVAGETAQANGTIDTRHEDVQYRFRFGTNPDALDRETALALAPAADAPAAVSAALTGLTQGTTYSYRLVTSTVLDGVPQAEVPGDVKQFTTAAAVDSVPTPSPAPTITAKHNGKRAVTFGKLKRGCVKRGRAIRVRVADKAEGTRRLTRFTVRASVGKRARTTKGPTGKASASVKVKRFPKRSGKKKLTLTVRAAFAGVPGVANSTDAVKRVARYRYCK